LAGLEIMAGKKRSLRLVTGNEPVTLESVVAPHPSQESFEDEFEALLDEVGDAEFGQIQIKETAVQAQTLKNWTSQDFANIYTRFRPHLERYSKRWLGNQSQIDEVVQDAFLYLMVTLPELDSEVGVLRFLKWKTRLLCLDVIRASGRAVINNIDDHELVADLPEISSSLEAADDAAVVRLALSKLTPRHREVLLATMYEEKSIAEVAAQVQLSENATRQLMFRARSAFKAALIGDLDTSGMSAGAILSVAARKAAAESKKVGVQAMVTLFVLVLAVGSWFSLNGRTPQVSGTVAQQKPANEGRAGVTTVPEQQPNVLQAQAAAFATNSAASTPETFDRSLLAATNDGVVVNEAALTAALNQGIPQDVQVAPSAFQGASAAGAKSYLIACQTQGCAATFRYSPKSGLESFAFNLTIDGYDFTAYMVQPGVEHRGNHLVFTGILSDLVDAQQVVWSNTALQGATVRLQFDQADIASGLQRAVLTVSMPKN
jgi:RNA polymerase sigma factor (sigma-70 family)